LLTQAAKSGGSGVIATVYRLVLGGLVTRGRIAVLGLLGVVGIVVGIAVGAADVTDRAQAAADLVNGFGLTVYVPVVTLVFASAALGDPAEDGSLVYLWLRPVARWRIVAGALGATLTVTLPLVVVPMTVMAIVAGGDGGLVAGAALASAVGVVAYASLFCYVGLRVRRALVWGLAYVLLWEGFVSAAGDNAARLAVRSYTRSILARAGDVELRLGDISPAYAIVVPLAVAGLAFFVTTRRLHRTEVA
jgi:ABC-2 type transport system permease protein